MTIHIGDCLDVMPTLPDKSVNLIVTSPPYGMMRANHYGGVQPDEYVDWFMPRAKEMMRLLTDDGSFVLNIRAGVTNGQRDLYPYKIIIRMREEQGWRLVEEYVWHKSKVLPMPAKHGRLKNAWELMVHFTVSENFKWRPNEVRQREADATAVDRRSRRTREGLSSTTRSGHTFHFAKAHQSDGLVMPSNVLVMSTAGSSGSRHPAQFPEHLPAFFIKLLTDPGDTVLDPFLGSGTTYRVAQMLERKCVGIEIDPAADIVPTMTKRGMESMLTSLRLDHDERCDASEREEPTLW